MTNYKLSNEAEDDLIGIYQYGFRQWGEQQADLYYWQLIKRFEELGETPLLYPTVEHIRAGYRRSVCNKHSIYYRITAAGVEVMAILRSQDTEPRFSG